MSAKYRVERKNSISSKTTHVKVLGCESQLVLETALGVLFTHLFRNKRVHQKA